MKEQIVIMIVHRLQQRLDQELRFDIYVTIVRTSILSGILDEQHFLAWKKKITFTLK